MSQQTNSEKPEIIIEEGENGLVISVPSDVHVEIKQEEKTEIKKEPTKLDNTLTLGLVGVLALAVIAAVIRKATKKASAQVVEEEVPASVVEAPTAPGSAGKLKLHNVEPKTAAMVMAIVADKLQKPINELRFISIKEVEE